MFLSHNITLLRTKLDSFNLLLSKFIQFLNIPDDIEHQLAKLDELLLLVDKILVLISIIPPITAEAKSLDEIVKSIYQIVNAQKIKLETIDNRYIEPIRDQFQELSQQLTFVIQKLDYLNAHLSQLPPSAIPPLNHVILEILKSIDKLHNDKLISISEDIMQLLNKVQFLSTMLNPLAKVLKEKISIPYSYRIKVKVPKTKKVKDFSSFCNFVWKEVNVIEWDWQVKTETFTFTVKEIFDGIQHIIDEVMVQLEREANEIIEPILKVINLKIELPGIPGIEHIEKELEKLAHFEMINVDNFENSLNNLVILMDKLN